MVKTQDDLLKFKLSIRMGKKSDLSDFERSVVVGARQALSMCVSILTHRSSGEFSLPY